MIKIPYPKEKKEKVEFENKYLNSLKKDINIDYINNKLSSINYNGSPLKFEKFITASFPELIDLVRIIEPFKKKLSIFSKIKLKKQFNYELNQPFISTFFMHQNDVDISTCFYCNIDFINSFKDMSDYKDEIHFINSADIEELKMIKGIGDKTANKIISERNKGRIKKIPQLNISSKLKNRISSFDFKNTHNHFTLDHVLPKSKYPYLSLSLYNLIPSCYSCNSKFKKDIDFSITDNLKYIIPSSNEFSLSDDFLFKIFYSKDFHKINFKSDFVLQQIILKNEKLIKEYLRMFKINGRFVFHKDKVLELIKLKVNYTDSKIKEISRLTGKSELEVKIDVFGKEIFDPKASNKPFSKLKQDIAKNINIK